MMEASPTRRAVPVIDLGAERVADELTSAIDHAATEFGFFQVVDHGIPAELIERVWACTRAFFALQMAEKRKIARSKDNTRGYYDRELTKNRRDLKEVLDLAHVPFPDAADDDPRNFHRVDGVNQWPDLPGFRSTMIEYLQACERLAGRLLTEFSRALGEEPDRLHRHFGPDHTSFVRLNHYPLTDPLAEDDVAALRDVTALGDMALHHHSDAGAMTLLLQDDVGGLQVLHRGDWIDVEPISGAIVVNFGDMMQVWSNDRFTAALHRVSPMSSAARFSLPYFFNPSYETDYAPLPGAVPAGQSPRYRSINWGHFRQARADGDYADFGHEIQISDFRTDDG